MRLLTKIKSRKDDLPYYIYAHEGLIVTIRSMVDKIHELIKLRSDNNLRATVALTSKVGAVGSEGVVFTTSTGSESLRINTIVVLQCLYYA